MTVDEALLARQNIQTQQEERQAAEAMRVARRQGAAALTVAEEGANNDYRAVRRLAKAEKDRKDQVLAQKAKDKAKEIAASPVRRGTNWLLRASWLNLIDSFGLTLIYINIHLFLRQVFPSMFCRLGEEWMPKQSAVVGQEAQEYAGRAFGLVEVMGLLLLDILAILVVVGVVIMIITLLDSILHIVNIFNDPFEYLDAVHGG